MPGIHSSPRPAERRTTAPAETAAAGPTPTGRHTRTTSRQGAPRRRPGLVTTEPPHRLVRGTDRTRSR